MEESGFVIVFVCLLFCLYIHIYIHTRIYIYVCVCVFGSSAGWRAYMGELGSKKDWDEIPK